MSADEAEVVNSIVLNASDFHVVENFQNTMGHLEAISCSHGKDEEMPQLSALSGVGAQVTRNAF